MALQTLNGGPWYPERVITDGTSPILYLTLNVANEAVGFVFKAPKTGTIDRVVYALGATVNVTGGPLNFDARLESVGATGLNSGSLLAAGSNANDPIDQGQTLDNREITLTTPVAVTKGQDIAFVLVAPSSGTFSVDVTTIGGDFTGRFPYCFNDTTKVARVPVIGLRYNDATYAAPAGCVPYRIISSSTITSATTPDEIGNRFQYKVPCRVNAIALYLDPNASSEFVVRIYDASDTVLLEYTFDSDVHADYGDGSMVFDLDEELELAANTTYRVTIRPTASNHELYYFEVENAAYLDMFDGGQVIHATERTDNGAWTDTATRRYFIALRMSALDDGAGGGGGGEAHVVRYHPGMNGGARG